MNNSLNVNLFLYYIIYDFKFLVTLKNIFYGFNLERMLFMAVDKIRVIISDRQKEVKIPTGIRMLIRRCCNAVLKMENFQGSAEVSVSLVDNKYIQNLNRQYREKDMPTDVLSFPMGKDGKYDIDPENGAKILGDIVISVEKVIDQSKLYGHSMQREIAYLVAHGMLHILGYDHESSGLDKLHMREKEEKVMNLLGLPCTSAYVLNSEEF